MTPPTDPGRAEAERRNLRAKELAWSVGRSVKWVYRKVGDGTIEPLPLGKPYLFPPDLAKRLNGIPVN